MLVATRTKTPQPLALGPRICWHLWKPTACTWGRRGWGGSGGGDRTRSTYKKQRVMFSSRASVPTHRDLQTHNPLAGPPAACVRVTVSPLTVIPLHSCPHLSPASTPKPATLGSPGPDP